MPRGRYFLLRALKGRQKVALVSVPTNCLLSPRITRLGAIRGERSGEGGGRLPIPDCRLSLLFRCFSARSTICALAFFHLVGMAFSVKEDEFSDPSDIGFPDANAVVSQPDGLPDLVQELHFVRSLPLGL
jgi:hypothetical protein